MYDNSLEKKGRRQLRQHVKKRRKECTNSIFLVIFRIMYNSATEDSSELVLF